jgi:hypothetical protein
LLWKEATNLKRKKRKHLIFSHEHAKRTRNGSDFASFHFEVKKIFLRNRCTQLKVGHVSSLECWRVAVRIDCL